MASLDDFFAKKDKSKKKSKAKFTTIDAIAQKEEEPKKPAPEKKKREPKEKPQQLDGSGERPAVRNYLKFWLIHKCLYSYLFHSIFMD